MNMELNGRHIVFLLTLFFGTIIAINVVFIVESIETFRGEDEQNPYLQGIDYNDTLARRAEQAALGWTATLAAERDASGGVDVTVTVRDKTGAPVDGVALQGELRHPADSERDQALALRSIGQGVYRSATVKGVAPGVWDVIVRADKPKSAPFEASRRLWLR